MKKPSAKKLAAKGSPVAKALRKLSPLPVDFLQALRLREWSAMEALRKGVGTITDIALMTEMLLMCEASIECGLGPEALQTCEQAENLLDSFADDAKQIYLDENQMKIIRDLHDFHDQQREMCSVGDYEKMINLVEIKALSEV